MYLLYHETFAPKYCSYAGHGPTSHNFETFRREAAPDLDLDHEDISVLMFDWLIINNNLKDVLRDKHGIGEVDLVFIKELIAGPLDPETGLPARGVDVNGPKWVYRGRPEGKSFLYEIVANKITGRESVSCN